MAKTAVIILDDGHGINTNGKRTPWIELLKRSIRENEFNNKVMRLVYDKLRAKGYTPMMSAVELKDTALSIRTNRANTVYDMLSDEDKANCRFISFHYNAFNGIFDEKVGGISVFAYGQGGVGDKLARNLYNAIIKGTKQYKRGVKYMPSFWVLKKTKMPAALIEFGFMDKLSEALLMVKDSFIEECANEVVEGICIDVPLQYEVTEELELIRNKINDTIEVLQEITEAI